MVKHNTKTNTNGKMRPRVRHKPDPEAVVIDNDTGQLTVLGEYDGTAIMARPGDEYVNATQMCKAAGKEWKHYWENKRTQRFLKVLSAKVGIPTFELVQSRRGNPSAGGGTWVYKKVALNLAQWCSPEFEVQVTFWIDELFTKGKVELPAVEQRPLTPGEVAKQHAEAMLSGALALIAVEQEVAAVKQQNRELAVRVKRSECIEDDLAIAGGRNTRAIDKCRKAIVDVVTELENVRGVVDGLLARHPLTEVGRLNFLRYVESLKKTHKLQRNYRRMFVRMVGTFVWSAGVPHDERPAAREQVFSWIYKAYQRDTGFDYVAASLPYEKNRIAGLEAHGLAEAVFVLGRTMLLGLIS
jgi:hypothetical protein